MDHATKIVYVLGAGFSIPAGGPTQAQIMQRIWHMRGGSVGRRKKRLRKFLQEVLNVDENEIQLEDIYTPIDRCLADGVSLRGVVGSDLRDIRNDLGCLVSQAIHDSFEMGGLNSSYVYKFAEYLVGVTSERARKAHGVKSAKEAKRYDPVAVISLNWDIVLDNAISKILEERHPVIDDDYAPFGVIDYCCYISSILEGDRRVRSGLWSLGCRGYNIKMLKLHGSMNWLQCPNCQRLFIGFYEKHVVSNYENPARCRHCIEHGHEVFWRESMVMPTYLKDLSNFQIKLIWQNASVEIMEARKLVFVGYSLPSADFEFRQLLSRMVHKDAEIEVHLYDGASTFKDEEKRYRNFFSAHDVKIFGHGAEGFVGGLAQAVHGGGLVVPSIQ